MTHLPPAPPQKSSTILRTLAVAAVIGLILFGVLWYTIFSAVTAALIAAGGTGVIVVGSRVSDVIESLFEMLANIVLAVLGAIAAVFAAIFSIFN
jgi:Flp pilus assembly protein TadB